MAPHQLSLPVLLRDQARFRNYLSPPTWSQGIARQLIERNLLAGSETLTYLWGTDAGLTHLLHAAGHRVHDRGGRAQYLSLGELAGQPPDAVCAGLEQGALVCIDDLQASGGCPRWQAALFDLYHRIDDAGGHLLVAARCSPRQLPLQLEDLRSRLGGGSVLHLAGYDDGQRSAILRFRASSLGLDLSADTAQFIVHRAPRQMSALMDCLRRLDRAALDNQRRPTVPFVKQTFGW